MGLGRAILGKIQNILYGSNADNYVTNESKGERKKLR
jgi:hypothetical protein